MSSKKYEEGDVQIGHYETNGGFVTSNRMGEGGIYKAIETWGGGAVLRPLGGGDDGLAVIKISVEVFNVLCKRRLKNETVSQAAERAIRSMRGRELE